MRKRVSIIGIVAVLIGAAIWLSGCANLHYKAPDGTEVRYTRLLTTADRIEGKVKDAKVSVSDQRIGIQELLALITAAQGVK